MNENNKSKIIASIITLLFIAILIGSIIHALFDYTLENFENKINQYQSNYIYNNSTFKIISSQENKNLENIIKNYAYQKGYNVDIEYAGTLEIVQKLNNGESYDGVWLSNSIWGYMLDGVSLSNSKCTSINPVIFAIKKSKAEELGFVGKTVYTKDIVQAIADGKLKFSM